MQIVPLAGMHKKIFKPTKRNLIELPEIPFQAEESEKKPTIKPFICGNYLYEDETPNIQLIYSTKELLEVTHSSALLYKANSNETTTILPKHQAAVKMLRIILQSICPKKNDTILSNGFRLHTLIPIEEPHNFYTEFQTLDHDLNPIYKSISFTAKDFYEFNEQIQAADKDNNN